MGKKKVSPDQIKKITGAKRSKKIDDPFYYIPESSVWDKFAEEGQEKARKVAAERGKDWDAMTDDEQLDFINDVVHEDRKLKE